LDISGTGSGKLTKMHGEEMAATQKRERREKTASRRKSPNVRAEQKTGDQSSSSWGTYRAGAKILGGTARKKEGPHREKGFVVDQITHQLSNAQRTYKRERGKGRCSGAKEKTIR